MKIFCERIFSEVLPALRASIAYELSTKHGLTQVEIAEKLGLTQPAISQYVKGVRGRKARMLLSNPSIRKLVKKLTDEIVAGKASLHEKLFEICSTVRKSKIYDFDDGNPFICLLKLGNKK